MAEFLTAILAAAFFVCEIPLLLHQLQKNSTTCRKPSQSKLRGGPVTPPRGHHLVLAVITQEMEDTGVFLYFWQISHFGEISSRVSCHSDPIKTAKSAKAPEMTEPKMTIRSDLSPSCSFLLEVLVTRLQSQVFSANVKKHLWANAHTDKINSAGCNKSFCWVESWQTSTFLPAGTGFCGFCGLEVRHTFVVKFVTI